MSFTKVGENLNFDASSDILTPKQALGDEAIAKRFIKMAKQLKRLAPKANDFLYFHSVIMHSAEASLIDQLTGEPIKNAQGKSVEGHFEKIINKQGKEAVKWVSADDIKPYRNQNRDIFPESELLLAHKKWVGRPLCKDHVSDSVDGIRGIIIDTYYDPKFKRVHALSAIDRKNYGDLARKIETGYANSVSMGTAVAKSVCSECQNIALTERDYCPCVRSRSHWGEINLDLNPIELSLVVNGADGLAKVRRIIASLNDYTDRKQARIEELKAERCVSPTELNELAVCVGDLTHKLDLLMNKEAGKMGELSKTIDLINQLNDRLAEETDESKKAELEGQIKLLKDQLPKTESKPETATRSTGGGGEGYERQNNELDNPPSWSLEPNRRLANIEEDDRGTTEEVRLLRTKVESMNKSLEDLKTAISNKEESGMNSARIKARAKARRAYWQGGGGVNEPTPGKPKYEEMGDYKKIQETEDKQMVGEPLETGSEGMCPGDKEIKEKLLRAEELEARKLQRRGYWQGGGGVNEPTPGTPKYPKEDAEKIRDTEDKQMAEMRDMGKVDEMVAGDKEVKEKMLRAKLKAKFTKSANKQESKWDIFAGDELVLTASAKDIFGEEMSAQQWDYLSSAKYGKDVMGFIRTEGLDKMAYLLKGAEEMPVVEPAPATPEVAPAPEVKPEEPKKDDMAEKVNAALSVIEEKCSEVRDLLGGSDSGLVEVDVDKEAPMDKVLASVESLLDDAADELALISEAFESNTAADKAKKLAAQALSDSEAIIAEANTVIESFKKAKAAPVKVDLEARAQKRADLLVAAAKEDDEDDKEDKCEELEKQIKELEEELKELKGDDVEVEEEADAMCAHDKPAEQCDLCMNAADAPVAPAAEVKPVVASKRDELIAQAEAILGKYQLELGKAEVCTEPKFFEAHPNGGTVTELTGTKTPEAKVETIEEAHKVIREVAEAGPRNVREAAAILQENIVEGKVKVAELDGLVAEGKADAEAVAYWKKFFGQAPGAGSFGADMSKDLEVAKKKASDEQFKVKLRRAFDIGLLAQDKGLIGLTKEALDSYVDEIMKFDDAAFESTKRVVASYGKARKSGAIPVVGSDAASVDINASTSEQPVSMADQLSFLGWK